MLGKVALILLVLLFTVSPSVLHAQDLTPDERAQLQAQLDQLQKEIDEQQQIIKDTQAKKNTLQGNVTLLNAQIKTAQAQIDAKNIQIKQLAAQIAQKNVVIGELSDRINRGKESLASILRQEQEIDSSSVVAIALSKGDFTSFFADIDAFATLKARLQDLFTEIKAAKAQTESEKADLADKQNQTMDAKYVIQTKQQQISSDKADKQQLLAITVNQETQYKKVLADKQAKAAQIRATLFPLRDAAAIPFGTALQYAQSAEKSTGVRAAFILAILTQESNLGQNVGQCYLSNDATGAGVGRNTGTFFAKVMNPTYDVPPFLNLALELGFDPHRQVVSCPQQVGWGGAMGPAQFIPSTWVRYKSGVASITGHDTPNPWAADDSITAMSLFLRDGGASAGTYTAERNAACIYFSGRTCTSGWVGTYGNQIMAKAASIQQNIDFLANS